MDKILQYKWTPYITIVVSLVLYVLSSRWIPRHHFYEMSIVWLILFGLSWIILESKKTTLSNILLIGIIFRLLLIDLLPWMSQDYFRFIWDGRLLFDGINPYLSTPLEHIEANSFPVNHAEQLFKGMGSLNAKHYTNYPPMSQLGYWIAALFGRDSILVSVVTMRVLLILADIGTFIYGVKILSILKLPSKNIGLYFLNPFVILELTGNLHFEALMVFFLTISLYFILKKKWILGSVLFGISVNVKLLPLILVPVFARFFLKLPIKNHTNIRSFFSIEKSQFLKYLFFVFTILGINFALFAPFISSDLIQNYSISVGLWFKNFEFNASLYYIARWIGYQITGWNMIAVTGKLMPAFAVLGIFLISIFRNNEKKETLLVSLLFSFSIYLFFTTTVHPWYLAIPLIISCFTRYSFLWVWTALVILSYNAYLDPNHWEENLWFVGLEYLVVFGVMAFELLKSKNTTTAIQ